MTWSTFQNNGQPVIIHSCIFHDPNWNLWTFGIWTSAAFYLWPLVACPFCLSDCAYSRSHRWNHCVSWYRCVMISWCLHMVAYNTIPFPPGAWAHACIPLNLFIQCSIQSQQAASAPQHPGSVPVNTLWFKPCEPPAGRGDASFPVTASTFHPSGTHLETG